MKRYGKLLLILLCGLALLAALTLTAAAYNYGTCIDAVYVQIEEPWPGYPLDFTAEQAGSTEFYEIDTTVNGDGYVNGIRWYDCTEKRNMLNYEEDRAKLGHQYRLEIAFKATKPNHYFWIEARNGVPITDFEINNSENLSIAGNGRPETFTFSGGTLTKFFYAREQVHEINVKAYELPVDGERPSFEAAGLHESHTVEKVVWTDLTENKTITEENYRYNDFIGGHEYAVSFWVLPQPGYMFGTLHSVTANGISGSKVSYERYEADDYYDSIGYIVTLELGTCPKAIKKMDLTVPAPEVGKQPITSLNEPSDAHYRIDHIRWYEDDRKMGATEFFKGGCVYELQIDVWADDGYRFPLFSAGTGLRRPNVSAKINGNTAHAVKAEGQDPMECITIRYSFGRLDSTVIDKVTIVDVVEPVAGEKPSYEAIALGQGYVVDTSMNLFDEDLGYFVNGISWFDASLNGAIVSPDDTFIAGHSYSVIIALKAEGAYTFLGPQWYPEFQATVNGTEVTELMDDPDLQKAQVTCDFFYCEPNYISTAILYNLDAPVAGETPDTQVTAAYPEAYTVSSVRWFGDESQLTGSAKFEAEKTYRAVVQIKPEEYYAFTEGAAVVLDNAPLGASTKVEVFSPDDTHSDGVYFDGTHLWVCRTFWRAAAAPEIAEPVSFSWEGSKCTLFLNEPQNCIVMAAAYQGGKLTGTTVLIQTQEPILTLTGDQVKVFFLDYTSYAPLRNAIVKPKGVQ